MTEDGRQTTDEELEGLVVKYGERHRQMIADALGWLREKEPEWKLDIPMNRQAFIETLCVQAE